MRRVSSGRLQLLNLRHTEVRCMVIVETSLRMEWRVRQIKTAIFAAGFIGRVHLDAVRRLEGVELAALSNISLDSVQRLGDSFKIPTVTAGEDRDISWGRESVE